MPQRGEGGRAFIRLDQKMSSFLKSSKRKLNPSLQYIHPRFWPSYSKNPKRIRKAKNHRDAIRANRQHVHNRLIQHLFDQEQRSSHCDHPLPLADRQHHLPCVLPQSKTLRGGLPDPALPTSADLPTMRHLISEMCFHYTVANAWGEMRDDPLGLMLEHFEGSRNLLTAQGVQPLTLAPSN